MPYVTPEERKVLLEHRNPATPGGLNFLITHMLTEYAKDKTINYTLLNEIMGVLESAKQEFYRRMVVPYEDEKKEQNGDVYP